MQVLRDAIAGGAVVALLAETASAPDEDVVGSCLSQVDADLAPSLRVYTAGLHRAPDEEGEDGGADADGRLPAGDGVGAFRAAAARVQQQAAEAFVARLAQDAPSGAARVGVAASLQNAAGGRAMTLVALDACTPAFARGDCAARGLPAAPLPPCLPAPS
jgi:hypothetical protein